jgi:hypothetical protein
MSALEAALLLNEQNYNEVVSVIYIFLVITAFLLETIAQRAKRLSFGPLFVAVAQVSLLFGVQAMIAATRKIDQPIDGIAVKFLLVSKAERDMAFGNPNDPTIFDSTYVLQFLSPVYLRTLKASLFLAFVAMAICRTSLAGNAILLKKACRRSLQYLFVFASLLLLDCLLFDSAFDAQPSGPASCRDPPPVKFRRKPNLIILTIDSWRRDTVSMESMPLTLQWLEEPKPDLARVEWADHDSCAIQSDQGYVALYYGMKGNSKLNFTLNMIGSVSDLSLLFFVKKNKGSDERNYSTSKTIWKSKVGCFKRLETMDTNFIKSLLMNIIFAGL